MSPVEIARNRATTWLNPAFDTETRNEVQELLKEGNEKELIESFGQVLSFGTGGLRGIMGTGTNRMNNYMVGLATQGLCNYLRKQYPQGQSVAIAYDCRNNSATFAKTTADVFSANGFKVFLFDELKPTPELSFAIRELACVSGVVITASHNPKEYNGYKAYWNDGGQLVAPHDQNVINEVNAITDLSEVKFTPNPHLIEMIGEDFDQRYLNRLKELSLSPESIARHKDMKIVYTPLHGTGVKLVPAALKAFGFTNIITVPEQCINDGNFPTVASPNPEEKAALNMALELAQKTHADLLMGTDPDSDRVGIAVRKPDGNMVLLNGNQTAALLCHYIITRHKETGKLRKDHFIVKTIVTSELLAEIARQSGVEYFDVLTGFKYIAEIIREYEGRKTYLCGGEESYGFLMYDYARDKDAVSACAIIAECAAWAADQGKSMYQLLLDIYLQYGYFKEGLVSLTKKGTDGAAEIKSMMHRFRENPPKSIDGSQVSEIRDYQNQVCMRPESGMKEKINLPVSDVLQFFTAEGAVVSIRPSGTEPKIKFYIGVKLPLSSAGAFSETDKSADEKIQRIITQLNIS